MLNRTSMLCCVLFSVALSAAVQNSPVSGDFAGLVKITDSGRRLYLQCSGTGSPTVLLEAGLRVRSDYWSYNTAKPPEESVFSGYSEIHARLRLRPTRNGYRHDGKRLEPQRSGSHAAQRIERGG